MYRLTLPLVLAFLLKVSYSLFANENKQLHSKVLLITENKLNQNFLNVDQSFPIPYLQNYRYRMGIITPDTITSKIGSVMENYLHLQNSIKTINLPWLAKWVQMPFFVNLNSYTKKGLIFLNSTVQSNFHSFPTIVLFQYQTVQLLPEKVLA